MLTIKYLHVPLGVDLTPLGLRKCIDPLSAVASLGSGILNFFSSQDANRSNLRMTRETNEMNYKIANETNKMSQAQFDKNMNWLREQYYDTDQLKRVKEAATKAGFNPALAMGSVQPIGSVGQASPTQFHAAQMDAGHVDPFVIGDGLSESIGHAVDAYYNNQLKKAETDKVGFDAQISRADAATKMRKNVEELRSMRLDNEHKLKTLKKDDEEYKRLQYENEQLDLVIKRILTDWDDTTKQLKYGNRLLEKQGDLAEKQTLESVSRTALNSLDLRLKPLLADAQVRLSAAQVNSLNEHLKLIVPNVLMMMSQRNLNSVQQKEISAKTIGLEIQNAIDKLDKSEKERLFGEYNSSAVGRFMKDLSMELGDLLVGPLKDLLRFGK